MHLFHSYKETIRLLDCEGRTYVIPANKAWPVPAIEGTDCNGSQAYAPFSIPIAKVAKMLCEAGVHFGLVPVPEVATASGIQFDLAAAAKNSTKARKGSEDGILERYIKGAKEDELAKTPVKPPSATITAILDARGLDLERDYNIKPVGYRISEGAQARDSQVSKLEAEVSELKQMLSVLIEDKKEARKREGVKP